MGPAVASSLASWLIAVGLLVALAAGPSVAQTQGPPSQGLVVRDGSLGSGELDVPSGFDSQGAFADYLIAPGLGKQQGGNLFHSFARFGIGAGETATFEGPQSVENVISRVTGDGPSAIHGTLRSTIPGANLYLMNPNGIAFGEGATLDVPGSFHATTADSIGFGAEGSERFPAQALPGGVLSAAPPMAFGFFGEGAGAPLSVAGATLEVPAGETLSLVGGERVALSEAELRAPGGRINVAAVASAGEVVLAAANADEPLDVGSFEALGEVELSHSTLDAGGEAPGAILLRGGRLVIEQGSQVLAENEGAGPGGRISGTASESVLVDHSLLSVNTSSAGNAGTIHLASPQIVFQNGPGLRQFPNEPAYELEVGASAQTSGSGAGGTIRIDAGALTLANGVALDASASGANASGRAGTIEITGDSVEISNRSHIAAAAYKAMGQASSGTIRIHLGDGSLEVDGARVEPGLVPYAFLYTTKDGPGTGAPGRIEIEAGSVELANGAELNSSCYRCSPKAADRPEDAATVWIAADRIVVGGSNERVSSQVNASTGGGEGDAGRIEVHGGSLKLLEGGILGAGTIGAAGNGGEIAIDVDSVFISGAIPQSFSGIDVLSWGASGRAGTIEIKTHTLDLERGGLIDAEAGGSTGTAGGAGEITIIADDWVRIHDRGPYRAENPNGHPIITVSSRTSGDAGKLDITTGTLEIAAGGIVQALNGGSGNPGTIDVSASQSIRLDGAGSEPATLLEVLSKVKAPAASIYAVDAPLVPSDATSPGSIHLAAPDITITHGAVVSTATIGGGDAGEVRLTGERIHILDGAVVDSTSILSPITFLHGGDAGSVTLDASELIEVKGRHPNAAFDNVSQVTSGTLSQGDAGAVALRAPRIVIDGGAVATTAVASIVPTAGVPHGGDISLDARFDGGQVIVRGGGRVDASTFVAEGAGRIDVSASESIVLEDAGRIESRTGGVGPGGDVTLRAPRIEIASVGQVSAESAPARETVQGIFTGLLRALVRLPTDDPTQVTGDAGKVTLQGETLRLVGGTVATNAGVAGGGDIQIAASKLVHLVAGKITAAVSETGHGGNIAIDPVFVILQQGSLIDADAGAAGGDGGNITITTQNYFRFPDSVVHADSTLGVAGTVAINAPDVDLAGSLGELPANFLDAASRMRERCGARQSGERAGSFAVKGAGGIPAEPDGPLPARLTSGALAVGSDTTPLGASAPGSPFDGSAPLLAASCP